MGSLFFVGTLVSLLAAIVIEFFIIAAFIRGLSIICSPLGILGGFLLLVLAFAALYSYSKGSFHARRSMIYIAPLGVLFGFIALLTAILGYSCPLTPIRVLFVAYVFEAIVAYRLRFDFRVYSPLPADMFLAGVALFTLGLLLVNIAFEMLVVCLLGNTVKLVGLSWLTLIVYRGSLGSTGAFRLQPSI